MTWRYLSVGSLLCIAGACCWSAPASACTPRPLTFREEARAAKLVLFGDIFHLTLPPTRPLAQYPELYASFLAVQHIVKPHAILGDRKRIALDLYLPALDRRSSTKWLVFCDVNRGQIAPYRGVPFQSHKAFDYVSGAVKTDSTKRAAALGYFFGYLEDSDDTVAEDAHLEFAKADYHDLRKAAEQLEPAKITPWLRRARIAQGRQELYALLLGHCGTVEDTKLIRQLLDEADRHYVEGLFTAYVMLNPKEGWPYLQAVLMNESHEFVKRYGGLRALRYFWQKRKDILREHEVLEGYYHILRQPDMADFAVEDLRRWQRWEMIDRVLDLFDKESHNAAVVKRAILRFALECSQTKSAPIRCTQFVEEQRRLDPMLVADTEELLSLEIKPPPRDNK